MHGLYLHKQQRLHTLDVEEMLPKESGSNDGKLRVTTLGGNVSLFLFPGRSEQKYIAAYQRLSHFYWS